jgi:hypothetical protein
MRTERILFACSLFLLGCHNSNNTTAGAGPLTVVQGRVMDDRSQVVVNASIHLVGTTTQTQSNKNGRFLLEVSPGAHELEINFGELLLCSACFKVEGTDGIDLGDLYPGRDSGCDRPTGCPADQDCDGLADPDELAGWEITVVQGDGDTISRHVTSDPAKVDSDGDGLTDDDELAARTDPGRRDTDGDGLPDFAELHSYKSNPWMVDSDGDSRGPSGASSSDPNLWDGYELLLTKTSPTLADTDGDGLTDWEEIHSGGLNPLVADLPRMSLGLYGDPSVILNITDVVNHREITIESLLEQENEGYKHTDTESTRMSIENTVSIHQELEVGTGNWPPSYDAKITTDTEFKHGYATESLTSWTEESVWESQENFESSTEGITNINYDDGMLWTAIKIVNNSNLAFRVGDLRVTAQRMKPGGTFEAVGTLQLGVLGSSGWEPFEGTQSEFILGPSVEYIGLVGADNLPAQVMRALISNPTALLFEIGSYSLFKLDPAGLPTVNFATIGESVVQRTGLIVVDYGNGTVERHMVATNVYRFPDGSGRGARLGEALTLLGIAHETAPHATDATRRVLTKVGTVEAFLDEQNPLVRGLWIVGGTSATFDAPITGNFDDLVLNSGDRIQLTFVQDSDGDGIFDGEEYLLGTNPIAPDSDFDGVTDYDESKVGWEVSPQGVRTYAVHSDPRFPDIDGDFLADGSERSLGTDPYKSDTDGDGAEDGFDPNPLSPPCLDGTQLMLSAWWDGSLSGTNALDIWHPDAIANQGRMFNANAPGSIVGTLGADTAFVFNQDGDRIEVDDPPNATTHVGVSPVHEFSVAMRLRWAGPPNPVPPGTWGTVLTKGPRHDATYALSIKDTGELRVSVYRMVWEHRWGWFFGWIDGLAADIRRPELTELVAPAPITPYEWVDVAATFGRDAMRLYVNGALVHEVSMNVWVQSSSIRNNLTTEYLVGNPDALHIGADLVESGFVTEGRLNGYLTNVQYFHRALTASEVEQLAHLGACRPTGGN